MAFDHLLRTNTMNRKEAQELIPMIIAYGEGAKIERFNHMLCDWVADDNPLFLKAGDYRIASTPRRMRLYRAADGIWHEMTGRVVPADPARVEIMDVMEVCK